MTLRSHTAAKAGSTANDFALEHNQPKDKTKKKKPTLSSATTASAKKVVDTSERARQIQRFMSREFDNSKLCRDFFDNRHIDEHGIRHGIENGVNRLARLAASGEESPEEEEWMPFFEQRTVPQIRAWLEANMVKWIEQFERLPVSVPLDMTVSSSGVSAIAAIDLDSGAVPVASSAAMTSALQRPVSVSPELPALPPTAVKVPPAVVPPETPATAPTVRPSAPAEVPVVSTRQAVAAVPAPQTAPADPVPVGGQIPNGPERVSGDLPLKHPVVPSSALPSTYQKADQALLGISFKPKSAATVASNTDLSSSTSTSLAVTRGDSPLVLKVTPSASSSAPRQTRHSRMLPEMDDGTEQFRYAQIEWNWARQWLHFRREGYFQDAGDGTCTCTCTSRCTGKFNGKGDTACSTGSAGGACGPSPDITNTKTNPNINGRPPPSDLSLSAEERRYLDWIQHMQQQNETAKTLDELDFNPVPHWIRDEERRRAQDLQLALPEYDTVVKGGMDGVANGFGPWKKKGGHWCRLLADGGYRPGRGGVFERRE